MSAEVQGFFAENNLMEDRLIEGTAWKKTELLWEAGENKIHNSVNSL